MNLAVYAIVGAVGTTFLVIGGCLIPIFQSELKQDIGTHVRPVNGSNSFNEWKDWSLFKPVYKYFYFFQVTNPDEIIRTGKNTTVKEVGPYVYRIHFERKKVSFAAGQTRLTYELYKTYTFERTMSVGNESDVITTVNLPILNLALRLVHANSSVNQDLKDEINRLGESLFVNVSVSDVLWGYENSNLRHLLLFLDACFGLRPVNDTTYGLMHQTGQPERTTCHGAFETSAGNDDIGSLWNVKKWNGRESLTVWTTKEANYINGTDGYGWPPQVGAQYVFDSDWCRSFALTRDQKQESGPSASGMATDRYIYKKKEFAAKDGFCQPTPMEKKKKPDCLDKGVLNVTACKDNVPLVLSQPHLLGVDDSYRKAVRGISPDMKQHSTTYDIEPVSGEVVEAARKMQWNAFVMHLTSFKETSRLEGRVIVLPVAWTKEVYSMSDSERVSLNRNVIARRSMYMAVQYTFIAFGGLLLISAIAGCCRLRSKTEGKGEREPLLHGK